MASGAFFPLGKEAEGFWSTYFSSSPVNACHSGDMQRHSCAAGLCVEDAKTLSLLSQTNVGFRLQAPALHLRKQHSSSDPGDLSVCRCSHSHR